ncbi:MAG TPA: IS1595 family transposase [Terracidiphilus sp.]|nr:IS1595 family transposase [Terracidiphilus sp.]
MFPDEETARVYLESRLWPKGVTCPTCAGQDRITPRKAGFHRCNKCQIDFTIRTGTIFERSHIPLHKWLYAMYLLVTARKGISSMQIAKEIGVQQKSAWFMLHRLREACGGELAKLQGVVEVDEAFFGGKEANKHESKKLNAGRGSVGKVAVVGLRERGGNQPRRRLKMVKIFKNYSTEKQRTTPIASVDGKGIGFLSSRDAINIAFRCVPVESARYSNGSTIQRNFALMSYRSELFEVSWDGEKSDPAIKVTTRAAFDALLAQYHRDARWTRVY